MRNCWQVFGCFRGLSVPVALAALTLVASPFFGDGASAEPAAAPETAPPPAAVTAPTVTTNVDPAMAVKSGDLDMDDATFVGEKVCAECHRVENNHFGHTTHAKVFRENPKNDLEKRVCEACHGPGSKHATKENNKNRAFIIGYTREWRTPIAKQNATCMACHKGGQRLHWSGSTHATNDLSCSDCHNPMVRYSRTGLLKKASVSETCETCHQQQRLEFSKRSHMPLHEGKMACDDCHNPHGSSTKTMIKADAVNDLCFQCHAEKRGPFIWEHAPARENCLTCHSPHGSNQDKLLVMARPFLCQQCHTGGHQAQFLNAGDLNLTLTAGNQYGGNNRALGRSCQNCHSQIHGSNHPAGARFQR
jgi:DmsE family decaheme c-type cytochrome